MTDNKVDAARVSWWTNVDSEKHTQKYLRADSKIDDTTRRLSLMDEFPEKTYPKGLDMSEKLNMVDQSITMEELWKNLENDLKIFPYGNII